MNLLVIGVGNTTPSVRVCDPFSKLRLSLANNKEEVHDIDISVPDPNSDTYAQDWYEIITTLKTLISVNTTTLIDTKIKEINPLFYGFVAGYITGSKLPYGSVKVSDNSEDSFLYTSYTEKNAISITYDPLSRQITFNGDNNCDLDEALLSSFSKVTIKSVEDSSKLTSEQLYNLGRILGVAHTSDNCSITNNLHLDDVIYKILAH